MRLQEPACAARACGSRSSDSRAHPGRLSSLLARSGPWRWASEHRRSPKSRHCNLSGTSSPYRAAAARAFRAHRSNCFCRLDAGLGSRCAERNRNAQGHIDGDLRAYLACDDYVRRRGLQAPVSGACGFVVTSSCGSRDPVQCRRRPPPPGCPAVWPSRWRSSEVDARLNNTGVPAHLGARHPIVLLVVLAAEMERENLAGVEVEDAEPEFPPSVEQSCAAASTSLPKLPTLLRLATRRAAAV